MVSPATFRIERRGQAWESVCTCWSSCLTLSGFVRIKALSHQVPDRIHGTPVVPEVVYARRDVVDRRERDRHLAHLGCSRPWIDLPRHLVIPIESHRLNDTAETFALDRPE